MSSGSGSEISSKFILFIVFGEEIEAASLVVDAQLEKINHKKISIKPGKTI
jgi:hypothetical protein